MAKKKENNKLAKTVQINDKEQENDKIYII